MLLGLNGVDVRPFNANVCFVSISSRALPNEELTHLDNSVKLSSLRIQFLENNAESGAKGGVRGFNSNSSSVHLKLRH